MLKKLLVIALLTITSHAVLIDDPEQGRELSHYNSQLRKLYKYLQYECPDVAGLARDLEDYLSTGQTVEEMKDNYNKLVRERIECESNDVVQTALPTTLTATTSSGTLSTKSRGPIPTVTNSVEPTCTCTCTTKLTSTKPTTTGPTTTKPTTISHITAKPTTTKPTTTKPTTAKPTTTKPTTTKPTITKPTTTNPTTTKPITTKPTTTKPTITKPTTKPPATNLLFHACMGAKNLTGSWRREHNGQNSRPCGPYSKDGYACDLHKDLQWFRFTGKAGTRMLNKCPEQFSCGGKEPYWTRGRMPSRVGIVKRIRAYGVHNGDCRGHQIRMQVVRCSSDTRYDFIYRYLGQRHPYCDDAFCGM